MFSLEQVIDQDNEVRIIDLFAGSLTLAYVCLEDGAFINAELVKSNYVVIIST